MPNYSFDTLNDKDFELLVGDLLSTKLDLRLQAFKTGRDQGIDLRYATPEDENNLIIQAKHYLKSSYSQLKSKLKQEVEKVKTLNPQRYILAISQGLSPQNKEELKNLFSPYIHSTQEIYGQDDLNQLLGEYPDIEKRHFKLWFSSVAMMESIIHNDVAGRSQFILEEALEQAKLFVPTKWFQEGIGTLQKKKCLILKGPPGIGKTFLAKMIILQFVSDKKANFVYAYDVNDAEHLISRNPNETQIIFLDDFLGNTRLELFDGSQKDRRVADFIRRITRSPNKFLLITSRPYILNCAETRSHAIEQISTEFVGLELSISYLSRKQKAELLYNHLFFSSIEPGLKTELADQELFRWIIDHQNFSPRIISILVDPIYLYQVEMRKGEYTKHIIKNLNNPSQIWEQYYETGLEDEDRILLQTLFSLGGSSEQTYLKQAYNARINYEIRHNGYERKHNSFFSSLKRLEGSFIYIIRQGEEMDVSDLENLIHIKNSSFEDYLSSYISDSSEEQRRLICSIIYPWQAYKYLDPADPDPEMGSIILQIEEIDLLFQRITFLISKMEKVEEEMLIRYFWILDDFRFSAKEKLNAILPLLLKKFSVPDYLEGKDDSFQFEEVEGIFVQMHRYQAGKEFILNHWESFVNKLFHLASEAHFDEVVQNIYVYDYWTNNAETHTAKASLIFHDNMPFELGEILPMIVPIKCLFELYENDIQVYYKNNWKETQTYINEYANKFILDCCIDIMKKDWAQGEDSLSEIADQIADAITIALNLPQNAIVYPRNNILWREVHDWIDREEEFHNFWRVEEEAIQQDYLTKKLPEPMNEETENQYITELFERFE